jgi:ferredoxin
VNEGATNEAMTNPLSQSSNFSLKISVDMESCQSNALCMSAAPDVFEVRDDGFLYLLIEEVATDAEGAVDMRKRIEEAARLCPTQAITLSE